MKPRSARFPAARFTLASFLIVPFCLLLLAGCGRGEGAGTEAESAAEALEPAAGAVEADLEIETDPYPSPDGDGAAFAAPDPAPAREQDSLAAREAELAREAARVAQRRTEVEAREAEVARRQAEVREPEPEEWAPAPESADDESWRDARGFPEEAAEPEPAPVVWETVTIPSGTQVAVELVDGLSSATSRAGDTFRARVRQPVLLGGRVALPAGSTVEGRVAEAVPLPRIGGQAHLELAFDRLRPPGGEAVPIEAEISMRGRSETGRDAATIGGAAAGGAVLGRVLKKDDKKKGALIGAILGATAGTVIASRTEGQEVVLPEGSHLELILTRPATVQVQR